MSTSRRDEQEYDIRGRGKEGIKRFFDVVDD